VSLALALPNPNSEGDGPRKYWKKLFRDADTSSERPPADKRKPEAKEEEVEQGTKPLEVSGLGEEAYWIPDPHVGTLYVLVENYFLRISLGGKDSDAIRSGKAKDFARDALKHLKAARANTSSRDPSHEHKRKAWA
jgi:hypothetical protein